MKYPIYNVFGDIANIYPHYIKQLLKSKKRLCRPAHQHSIPKKPKKQKL